MSHVEPLLRLELERALGLVERLASLAGQSLASLAQFRERLLAA